MEFSISFIVPIYNAGDHLEKCLKSIAQQSYLDFEVLMCDDGSTDSSARIAKEFAWHDARFRYFFQNNSGPGDARNLGLKNAQNRFVTFADADDYLHPDYLKLLVNPFLHEEVQLSCCGFTELSIDHPDGLAIKDFTTGRPIISATIFQSKIFEGLGGVVWAKLFLRDIIVKNLILFNSNVRLSEDLIFVLEYSKYVKNIATVDENLYFYNRLNETGLTRKLSIENVDDLEITNHEIEKLSRGTDLISSKIIATRTANLLVSLLSQIALEKMKTSNVYSNLDIIRHRIPHIEITDNLNFENSLKVYLFNKDYKVMFVAFAKILHFLRKLKK